MKDFSYRESCLFVFFFLTSVTEGVVNLEGAITTAIEVFGKGKTI